jgi:GT2 family glycosyltransferase
VARCYSVAALSPPRPPTDAWVVVVNWNGAHLLGACLDALARQSHPVHVVVVDNGSTDSSEKVVTERPGVDWCAVGENLGFAKGSNVGIRRALDRGARYVALVNTDVVVEPEWVERLVADAEAHPEAGIFGGLLVFADDPGRVNSTGLVMDAFGRVRDRDFGVEVARLAREDGPTLGVTGGAVLLRAAALRQVGLLDPAYFAYYEDADLCARARRAGIACRYVAGARAAHGFGRTIGAGSPQQRYLLARNHLRYVATHLPLWKAVPMVIVLCAVRAGVKAPLELVRGRHRLALAQLRGAAAGASVGAAALARRLLRLSAPSLDDCIDK